jgi:hypothetical protein
MPILALIHFLDSFYGQPLLAAEAAGENYLWTSA